MRQNEGLSTKQKILVGTVVFAVVWTLMASVMEFNNVMAKDQNTGCTFIGNKCLMMESFKDWYVVGEHMLNFTLLHALIGSSMGFTASTLIGIVPHRRS